MTAKLTVKQRMFVNQYVIDFNGKQAAIRAGYSAKTAEQTASRLLTYVKVKAAVDQALADKRARADVTADRVIGELAKIAFADATDFAVLKGRTVHLRDTDKLPAEKKAAISSIKMTRDGPVVEVYDKQRALELLGKHLGIFTDKLELLAAINVELGDLDDAAD